jgi:hemolysin D
MLGQVNHTPLALHLHPNFIRPSTHRGQPQMIVVPDTVEVTEEVSIANQDNGFVNAGQMAEVKLETFSYTKYGTVLATVDAVTDEKKGSYYPAMLTLKQRDVLIDGKRNSFSSGMNITEEIKTGAQSY